MQTTYRDDPPFSSSLDPSGALAVAGTIRAL
jgi:hypothetical protein